METAGSNPGEHSESLSTALELRNVTRHAWDADDLREMWRHQLATPLPFGLGHMSAEAAQLLNDAGKQPLLSLGQLLESPSPPTSLLKLVRRFSKSCRGDPENSLPRELLLLTYYASIVVALLRCGERITGLGNEPLLRGLRWYRRQEWVDERTRQLLAEGEGHLLGLNATDRADSATKQH